MPPLPPPLVIGGMGMKICKVSENEKPSDPNVDLKIGS